MSPSEASAWVRDVLSPLAGIGLAVWLGVTSPGVAVTASPLIVVLLGAPITGRLAGGRSSASGPPTAPPSPASLPPAPPEEPAS